MINKIALAGCGNVGTALLEILHEKKDELREKYGFEYKVVLVSDLMKGVIMDPEGLDLGAALESVRETRTFEKLPRAEGSFEELLERSGATVLAEGTPTNLKTGEPGLTHIRAALSRGISVTTTNKGPIALAFDELTELAKANGAQLSYEGVVMSGTPLIDMMKNGVAGCSVLKLEGILNGTTNFMLTKMGEGMEYGAALAEAQALGYAEADPTGDVEGWDAAVKVSILAKILFGADIPVDKVEREGITKVTPARIEEAKKNGCAVKLLAGLDASGSRLRAYVEPKEIPASHPLASINGGTNAITVTTDNLGDVTLIGPGAGRRETGQALLGDIIRMSR